MSNLLQDNRVTKSPRSITINRFKYSSAADLNIPDDKECKHLKKKLNDLEMDEKKLKVKGVKEVKEWVDVDNSEQDIPEIVERVDGDEEVPALETTEINNAQHNSLKGTGSQLSTIKAHNHQIKLL